MALLIPIFYCEQGKTPLKLLILYTSSEKKSVFIEKKIIESEKLKSKPSEKRTRFKELSPFTYTTQFLAKPLQRETTPSDLFRPVSRHLAIDSKHVVYKRQFLNSFTPFEGVFSTNRNPGSGHTIKTTWGSAPFKTFGWRGPSISCGFVVIREINT